MWPLFNVLTGVTTNHAEGMCNLGESVLKSQFAHMKLSSSTFIKIRDTLNPTKICEEIKNISDSSQNSSNTSQLNSNSDQNNSDASQLNSKLIYELNFKTQDTDEINLKTESIKKPLLSSTTLLEPCDSDNLDNSIIDADNGLYSNEVVSSRFCVNMPCEAFLEPIRFKSSLNSKVYRALAYVKNNKVKHDIVLGIYQVIDEQNICNQITPSTIGKTTKYACSCIERLNCVQILAVEKSNGKNIENLAKYPKAKMDDLVKANNNNQLSGRKKKGHEKNSKPNENKIFDSSTALSVNEQKFPPGKISKQKKAQIKKFILSKKINMLESVIKKRTLIEADYLETDPEMLSDDVFCENIEFLEPYFTSDGWEKLTLTLKEKVKKSNCFICIRLCLSGCIQCSRCFYWLHFKCENLDKSKFSDNHESVFWKCIKCDTDA
ncbi:unnamed protein product [Brachionus calyciflorus]|uniref:Uncharacterized protein n=1 Tax=Brachionus calyciflorus TaxID=104777 RepID=A0A814A0I8_9BILA|nr:unnamed protein product [Brachionus calyciflorus]